MHQFVVGGGSDRPRSTSCCGDNPNVIFTAETARWNSMVHSYHERLAEAKFEYHTTAYNCFNYIRFSGTLEMRQPVFASPAQRTQCQVRICQWLRSIAAHTARMHAAELYLWLLQTTLDRTDMHGEDGSSGSGRTACSHRSGTAVATSAARTFSLYQSEYERTSVPAFRSISGSLLTGGRRREIKQGKNQGVKKESVLFIDRQN